MMKLARTMCVMTTSSTDKSDQLTPVTPSIPAKSPLHCESSYSPAPEANSPNNQTASLLQSDERPYPGAGDHSAQRSRDPRHRQRRSAYACTPAESVLHHLLQFPLRPALKRDRSMPRAPMCQKRDRIRRRMDTRLRSIIETCSVVRSSPSNIRLLCGEQRNRRHRHFVNHLGTRIAH